jgi:hypothetical protein
VATTKQRAEQNAWIDRLKNKGFSRIYPAKFLSLKPGAQVTTLAAA